MANTVNIEMADYIAQNADQLFTQSTVGAKTLDYVDLMLDVKTSAKLNYLDSSVELDEAKCEWDPKGSDDFYQRDIEVHPVSIQKEYCALDFNNTVAALKLKYQAGRLDLPWQEAISRSNVEAIKAAHEEMLWSGNEDAGVTGFLADIENASATTVEFSSGDTTVAKVDALVAALDAKMLAKGVNIFMSFTDFRNYVMESNGTCCANRPLLDAASDSIIYAGDSRIKLVPVLGLEGLDNMVAATPDALVYATDIEGSETVYRWFYDDKNRTNCFEVLFMAGTAVRFPSEVILGVDA